MRRRTIHPFGFIQHRPLDEAIARAKKMGPTVGLVPVPRAVPELPADVIKLTTGAETEQEHREGIGAINEFVKAVFREFDNPTPAKFEATQPQIGLLQERGRGDSHQVLKQHCDIRSVHTELTRKYRKLLAARAMYPADRNIAEQLETVHGLMQSFAKHPFFETEAALSKAAETAGYNSAHRVLDKLYLAMKHSGIWLHDHRSVAIPVGLGVAFIKIAVVLMLANKFGNSSNSKSKKTNDPNAADAKGAAASAVDKHLKKTLSALGQFGVATDPYLQTAGDVTVLAPVVNAFPTGFSVVGAPGTYVSA